jgi:hypothetical protein
VEQSTTQTNPLAALGAHLGSRGFKIDLNAHGLTVTNPKVPGCCEQVAHAGDTITCRPRPDDGGRMWFFTSWGEPIAEAHRITDAALFIRGVLSGSAAEGVPQ